MRAEIRSNRAKADLRAEDELRLTRFLPRLPVEKQTAAIYASTPDEPGTLELIDLLYASGWQVLLPVLRKEPAWARFVGWSATRPGWRGIVQPTTEPLSAEVLTTARLIIVSCLAVDRSGYRLGVGGGWYDRALRYCHRDALVLAWARDEEVLAELPREDHDLPCQGWVTQSGLHLTKDQSDRTPAS